MYILIKILQYYFCNYSKRHNKFLLPVHVKAICGSFYRTETEISNVVDYKINQEVFEMSKNDYNQNAQNDKQQDKANNSTSQNSQNNNQKNNSKNSSGSNAQDNQKNNF